MRERFSRTERGGFGVCAGLAWVWWIVSLSAFVRTLQELDGQAVAVVEVGEVDEKTCGGVLVG